jgi:hypothetical protein
MGDALPAISPFQSGQFPVEVIVVWDADGGWHAATVLYRTRQGPVTVHPNWCEPFTLAADPWKYLAERVREGRGGNGYDYDVWGFEVATEADIAPVVTAWEAEVVATGSPIPCIVTDVPIIGADHSGDPVGGPEAVIHNEVSDFSDGEEAPETTATVLVSRVASPDWFRGALPDGAGEALTAKSGEGPGWGDAIPGLFRTLAAPLTFEPMPALSEPPDRHPDALGYWTALLHMLIYSLGWARPDRGLRWWYDTGRPVDDPRLAVLDHVWRRDGYLEDFALWLSNSTWILPLHQLAELTGHADDDVTVEPHPEWTAAARVREHSMFDGGSDPYHLSVHTTGPLEQPRGEALLLRSGRTDRQAVLILDSMVGWYRALSEEGAALPELGERSWHVDVVVRPVGWLGTYRRSRATGLWFSGRHRSHTPGT